MRVALVSFYDSARFDEYPVAHSLGAMRLGAYLRRAHPAWQVRLRAFDERSFDLAEAAASLEGFDVIGVPAYIWTLRRARDLAEAALSSPVPPLVVCGGPETRAMDYSRWPIATVFVMGQGEEPLLWLCEQRADDPNFDGTALTDACLQPVYSSRRARAGAYRHAVPDRGNRRLPHGVDLFSPEFADLLTVDPIDTDFAWYETARGCIYECSFCGHNTLPYFATFDIDTVRREIVYMREHGIRRVFVIDPILGGKAARGKEILSLFRSLAPNISLSAYMRPEFLDEEFVDLLAEANLHELLMGLQTTNPSVPRHVRGNHFDKIMKFVPGLAARGVRWRAELIVGLPGDDMSGLRESLRFTIEQLRPWSVHAYHLTAIPETKLFDLLDRVDTDIWIKADERLRVVSSSSYSESDLREMLAYAGAVTSLHSHWRGIGIVDPPYAVIDERVRAVFADPGRGDEARSMFARMSHEFGRELWRTLNPLPRVTARR